MNFGMKLLLFLIPVLVLVVAAALFTGWLGSGRETIDIEHAFTKGCAQLKTAYNCDFTAIKKIDVQYQQKDDESPKIYKFGGICNLKLNLKSVIYAEEMAVDPRACARLCGCLI